MFHLLFLWSFIWKMFFTLKWRNETRMKLWCELNSRGQDDVNTRSWVSSDALFSPAGASGCLLSVNRFHNHRNLQLCFINNSDSEDEEEGGSKKVTSVSSLSVMWTFLNSLNSSEITECQVTWRNNIKSSFLIFMHVWQNCSESLCFSFIS